MRLVRGPSYLRVGVDLARTCVRTDVLFRLASDRTCYADPLFGHPYAASFVLSSARHRIGLLAIVANQRIRFRFDLSRPLAATQP